MSIINMACPVCGADVKIDVQELIKGCSFACGKCQATIRINVEHQPLVKDTMEKFEALKNGNHKSS